MTHSPAWPLTLASRTTDHRQDGRKENPLLSLSERFATLPDPRWKHGVRDELAVLLTCLGAALRCHCNSTLAVGHWCHEQHDLLTHLFGARRCLCPSESLDRTLLPRVDAEPIACARAEWRRSTRVAHPEDPMALDGTTVRGANTAGQAAPHVLSFRTHQSQETRFQVAVSEKTTEIPVAQARVPCVSLTGRVCTADAPMQSVDAVGG
jgi:hypothetical protein